MEQKNTIYNRKRPAHQPVADRINGSRIVFLTVCTEKRTPILCSNAVHELLIASWQQADTWVVGRYLLMPDHLHLFCSPKGMEYPALSTWVSYWKSISARAWPNGLKGKVWQRDFWDTQLRKGENYTGKWHYVMNNPVRAGLVDSPALWKYQGELNELFWHD